MESCTFKHKASTAVLQILSSLVGFLDCPQDLVSCLLASQQLQAAVRSGRVSFELTGRPRQLLSYPSKSGQLDDLMQSLIRYMPGAKPSTVAVSCVAVLHIRRHCFCAQQSVLCFLLTSEGSCFLHAWGIHCTTSILSPW
jgi:hypothetical protein